jgi:hypothetical protein
MVIRYTTKRSGRVMGIYNPYACAATILRLFENQRGFLIEEEKLVVVVVSIAPLRLLFSLPFFRHRTSILGLCTASGVPVS